MELKPDKIMNSHNDKTLLIVPYGIETSSETQLLQDP